MSDLPLHAPSPSPPPPPRPAAKLRRVTRSFPALRSIAALILREMSTRYGRSPGGYVWALLEPLGGILILSLGFSLLLRAPPLGSSFLLFYATGFMPFQLYMSVSNNVMRSLAYSKALLSYPAVTWIDAVLARFMLNTLTNLLVTFILMTGILAVVDGPTTLDIPPMAVALALSAVGALGVGTLNCAIIGLFPVWGQVWSIVTKPLFILSGIFFLYDDLPERVQAIMWWNPLLHIVGLFRRGIYPTYAADYVSEIFVLLVSLTCLVLGLLLLGRYHRQILNT